MAGYEGVAIVRTMDARQGLVELLVAPAFYQTLLDIIQALSTDIALSLLPREEVDSAKCQGTSVEPPALSTRGGD
jgi:hypothetical protein